MYIWSVSLIPCPNLFWSVVFSATLSQQVFKDSSHSASTSLQKKPYICFVISGMMFLRLLANSAVFSLAFGMTLPVLFVNQWGWLIIVALIISTIVDVAIAAILVVSLRIQTKRAPKRTTALVDKMITWTIETALITSVSSIVIFICFVTMRQNFI
ncbi:hypothetical protein MSAN_00207700 [Mycena sanguinolenta]|uniref:DUF6534 domain-containing protein n=1 Tax=Mycena sanguinolenta TaxID=230812 RepID=A0A8H6ZI72_9AGAR|nr:hypothetical protein MSAN_00207700 [Mycena sanguinolenta]